MQLLSGLVYEHQVSSAHYVCSELQSSLDNQEIPCTQAYAQGACIRYRRKLDKRCCHGQLFRHVVRSNGWMPTKAVRDIGLYIFVIVSAWELRSSAGLVENVYAVESQPNYDLIYAQSGLSDNVTMQLPNNPAGASVGCLVSVGYSTAMHL